MSEGGSPSGEGFCDHGYGTDEGVETRNHLEPLHSVPVFASFYADWLRI